MDISPSPSDRAAATARPPAVRYYVRDVWEIKREEPPVQDPDSPQSPSQIPDDVPPLVLPNPNPSPSWLSRRTAFEQHLPATHDEPSPPEEPPARRPEEEDPDLYYYLHDPDDPECVRRCHEVQSKRYAVHALRRYNADPGNGVKYELVEATARSNSILLNCPEILGHVVFTARPADGGRDRAFFAEVRLPDHALACMISLDDDGNYYRAAAADDGELCQFCRQDLRHPEVHPELR